MKLTSLAHYIGGFLAALLTPFNIALSVLITSLFIIYEFNEDWYLTDEAYVDLREFLVGMIAGGILILGTKIISYWH